MIAAAQRRSFLGRTTLAAALFLVSFAGSCIAPPVAEKLRIELLPGGRARVTARVELAAEESSNPKVTARLREWRQELAAGSDPWSQRFARLDAEEDQQVWSRKRGTLVAAERSAILADAAGLAELFTDTPVTLSFTRRPGEAEIAFYHGAASRAGRAERRRVETALAEWSGVIAGYLRAMDALHATAADDAVRERRYLVALFGEAEEAKQVELDERERAAVQAVDDAMSDFADVLPIAGGEAYSLEELSRLVYDPFPADLEVHVAGEVIAVEGFAPDGAGSYTVPGLSLWRSLTGLARRWPALTPYAQVDVTRSVEDPEGSITVDYDALVAGLARSEPPPDAQEIQRALAELLRPAAAYRLTWRPVVAPPAER